MYITYLTLHVLNCFEDYKRCIRISYHILDFIQQNKIKFTMEKPYVLPILYCQCHACWCTGDFKSQCISRQGIDFQSQNIPSLAWEELIVPYYLTPASHLWLTNPPPWPLRRHLLRTTMFRRVISWWRRWKRPHLCLWVSSAETLLCWSQNSPGLKSWMVMQGAGASAAIVLTM